MTQDPNPTSSESPSVEDRTTKTWLDVAPEYVEFLGSSIRSPAEAVAPLAEGGRVSSRLSALMLGGLALCYVLAWTFPAEALETDTGNVMTFLRRVDPERLPAIAVFLVVCGAWPLHLLLGAKGTRVQDTANAALATLAVVLPLGTLIVLAVAHWGASPVLLGSMAVLGAFSVVQFIRCRAALTV
jgi:hypothetical protein